MLLPRFYGAYQLTDPEGEKTLFLCSMFVFASDTAKIRHRFDLKGSTYGRAASEKEKAKGEMGVLKDLDWMAEYGPLNPEDTRQLHLLQQQIVADASFLEAHNSIDYSLLVGVGSHAPPPEDALGFHALKAVHEVPMENGGVCF